MGQAQRHRFAVVIRDPSGDVTLVECRRIVGASVEMAAHVQRKRDVLRGHAQPGERILSGHVLAEPGEIAAEAVIVLDADGGIINTTVFAVKEVIG